MVSNFKTFKYGNNYKTNMIILGKRRDLTDPETWKYMISVGADIHVDNNCALVWVFKNGYLVVVKYLIEYRADINAVEDALFWASRNGHLEVVKYLIESGANIHADDDFALRLPCGEGYLKIIKCLLENGANIHAKNDDAFTLAYENEHFEIVQYLLKHKKDYDKVKN
ncbi:ankyrin repeat protein [Acanthamoeba polyphaga moumouvirus]|uniref:Ankyrin repeat protein n=1 Tax=Acanthamoeba polyphaga moumouvirus TaxID=1269028 RepID=L7RCB7_9VIRU|nr:ankyrin repeat protein [Acanthamoeba polyphaga moumouvirus]AGC01583.1 ankyrin repeat protein [Acanthamoeba polyphaga moumouvirus]